jgi:hypothetical protein
VSRPFFTEFQRGRFRALPFRKATGFDALEGAQDIGRGVQLSTTVGSSIGGVERGQFVASNLFLCAGTDRSYVGLRTQVDALRSGGAWGDVVASGRLAWYARPSPRQTRSWSVGVSYTVTGRTFWREPLAVSRARVGGPTTEMFVWP